MACACERSSKDKSVAYPPAELEIVFEEQLAPEPVIGPGSDGTIRVTLARDGTIGVNGERVVNVTMKTDGLHVRRKVGGERFTERTDFAPDGSLRTTDEYGSGNSDDRLVDGKIVYVRKYEDESSSGFHSGGLVYRDAMPDDGERAPLSLDADGRVHGADYPIRIEGVTKANRKTALLLLTYVDPIVGSLSIQRKRAKWRVAPPELQQSLARQWPPYMQVIPLGELKGECDHTGADDVDRATGRKLRISQLQVALGRFDESPHVFSFDGTVTLERADEHAPWRCVGAELFDHHEAPKTRAMSEVEQCARINEICDGVAEVVLRERQGRDAPVPGPREEEGRGDPDASASPGAAKGVADDGTAQQP